MCCCQSGGFHVEVGKGRHDFTIGLILCLIHMANRAMGHAKLLKTSGDAGETRGMLCKREM